MKLFRPPLARRPRRVAPLFALTVVALYGTSPAPVTASKTLDPATIREQVLPNGLKVVVRASHAAGLVSLQYWVRAGVFREDEESAGTAHFIEHLLFKGTKNRPQGQIDAEIEDMGGVLEAETDKDWTTLRVTVATPFWAKALEVIADAVQHPLLRLQDMEAERQVILNEIAARQREPLRVLIDSLYYYSFSNHPYRFPTTGTPQQVVQIKLGPLRDYFRRYYTPANAVLVVVGDVTPEAVFKEAGKLFQRAADGRLEAFGERALRLVAVPAAADEQAPRRHVIPSPFRGAYYGVAFPAPGVKDVPDVYAMDVLVTLLQHGPSGRLPALWKDLPVRRSQADYQTLRDPGILTVMVAAAPEQLEEIETRVLAEFDRLRATVAPAAEIEATKSILAGSYALDNETFAGQGKSLGYYAMIDRWQFASTYLDEIARVTPAQVQAAARKYFVPERAVTVILRPRGSGQEAPRNEPAEG